jgi:hypothetical protein
MGSMLFDSNFYLELSSRAWQSALASMSTSGLALFSGLAYGLYRIFLAFRKERWRGVKEHLARDVLQAMIFGIFWWGVLFLYHLIVKVPSEIRTQANSVKVPQIYRTSEPSPLWLQKQGKLQSKPIQGYQGFHEKLPDEISVSLGGGGITVTWPTNFLRKHDAIPFYMGGYNGISGHLKGDVLYCDVTLWGGGTGPSSVEIKENKFTVRPPNWDRNFSQNALEVINENGQPILQLIRTTPSHWVVNGVFISPDRIMVATDKGTRSVRNVPNLPPELREKLNKDIRDALANLKPIFKYPSYQHEGEYVDNH